MNTKWPLWPGLLAICLLLGCGCTAGLWENGTFARRYQPANPTDLHLFYSKEREDLLVQYAESRDGKASTRIRRYWLEPNTPRVNKGRKPRFVSAEAAIGLIPVPLCETNETNACLMGATQLHALAGPDDFYFTLFSGEEKVDCFTLPNYAGSSQRVKQILLTPITLVVDAAIFGAVGAYLSAPYIMAGGCNP